jgi:tRNA-modifying protein YgfZ
MKAALLSDRGVVKVAGDDARKFLNGLVTIDVDKVAPGHARFAALLTPQGKIIADFIVAEAKPTDGGGFFLDCPRALALELAKRLNFYKLRAKVSVEDFSETLGVLAIWDGAGGSNVGLTYADPRLPDLGVRCMVQPHHAGKASADAAVVDAAEYDAHRITLGVPQGGADFTYDDAFPHEADMDQLGGVDFDKGCFVGQEVVSRIEHRGSARTRVVPVVYAGAPPAPGSAVTAAERSLGTMGSGIAGRGLAALRLDRVEEAFSARAPITAGGIAVRPVKPRWARFAFPGAATVAQ